MLKNKNILIMVCSILFLIASGTSVMAENSSKYPDVLGTQLTVKEINGNSVYNGIWTRRPGTDIFDAIWNDSIIDVIEIESVNGNQIVLYRYGNSGRYTCTLSADGRSIISGTADWYQSDWYWSAAVTSNLQIYFCRGVDSNNNPVGVDRVFTMDEGGSIDITVFVQIPSGEKLGYNGIRFDIIRGTSPCTTLDLNNLNPDGGSAYYTITFYEDGLYTIQALGLDSRGVEAGVIDSDSFSINYNSGSTTSNTVSIYNISGSWICETCGDPSIIEQTGDKLFFRNTANNGTFDGYFTDATHFNSTFGESGTVTDNGNTIIWSHNHKWVRQ